MDDKITGNTAHFSYIDKLGLSPYSLLEGAWAFVGIIEGIRTEIWYGDKHHPIFKLWVSLELIDKDTGELTIAGSNIVNTQDLFEYEFSMMQQQLVHDFETDPNKYVKLRGALERYSDIYLEELTKWMIDLIPEGGRVLDFGGGNGHYLHKILVANQTATGILYDKAPATFIPPQFVGRMVIKKESFKDETGFFQEFVGCFDSIVMSEVLHCIAVEEWPKTINLLTGLLKSGGSLIILEQQHGFRLDWRLQSLSDGMSIPPAFISRKLDEIVLTDSSLSVSLIMDAPTHYGICVNKS